MRFINSITATRSMPPLRMISRYSVTVRSLVSVCLRFERPIFVQEYLPCRRLYSSGVPSCAKPVIVPLPSQRHIVEDSSLDKKKPFPKAVSLKIKRKLHWTDQKLERLREAVEKRQTSEWTWQQVADYVGDGVSSAQCSQKASSSVAYSKADAEWSEKEIEQLQGLVEKHTDPVHRRVSWKSLSEILHRSPKQIFHKWKESTSRSRKALRFTPEQDALIQERVAGWGEQRGVWTTLQREMGIKAMLIRARYYRRVAGTSDLLYFTPEMDKVVLAAHKALRPDKPTKLAESTSNKPNKPTKSKRAQKPLSLLEWAEVAAQVTAQVGTKVTSTQCRRRWVNRLKFQGLRMGVEFTPTEVARLIEFVEEHQGLRTPWVKLGRELNIMPAECLDKWKAITQEKLKKGIFTPAEDELLMRKVKEWGDPKEKKGLWVKLSKEMGRREGSLVRRYDWLMILGGETQVVK